MTIYSRGFLVCGAMFLVLPLFPDRALACSCAVPPPPCEAIGWSDLVFLGTVTEISTEPGYSKRAKMRVDHAYKGALKETVELFDDGMCDGPRLEVGRQYLMYTSGPASGPVPARGCTRSRRVEQAQEDLQFLTKRAAGKTITHISGTVRVRMDEAADGDGDDDEGAPLTNVLVTLTNEDRKIQATTDVKGAFSFPRAAPGEYEITADLPGYRLDWAPDSITLHANGCAEAHLFMKVDRRVQGFIRDDKGALKPGVRVEMISTGHRPNKLGQPVLLAVSDEDGRYVIDGIPPGEYYLGVNIKRSPTPQNPYASTYYPNTTRVGQALPIAVAAGVSVQEFDLRLADELPVLVVQGRMLTSDGKPPSEQNRPQVRIKEPGLVGQIERESIKIDAEGRFQIELCEGVRYSAFAFTSGLDGGSYSAPVEFMPTKENNRLELVLDKTRQEFGELSRRTKK